MSLIVCAIRLINNEIVFLEDKPNSNQNDLFGVESTRESIWSSEVLVNLGCTILPKLKEEDLYCFEEELQKLKTEFNLILLNLDDLVAKLKLDKKYLDFRIKNGIEAINIASKYEKEGGVYIG